MRYAQVRYVKSLFTNIQKQWNMLKISLYFKKFTYFTGKSGAQPEIFQGKGGFVKLEDFDKHFIKKSRKKVPHEENFGVFSLRYS